MPDAIPENERHLLAAFRRAVRRHFEEEIANEDREAEARRAEVLPRVREALSAARAEGRVGRAWLFGSYAWGRPGERSDVDLLVEDCVDVFDLAGDVGAACGREVHAVARERAPASLVARAVSEGTPL